MPLKMTDKLQTAKDAFITATASDELTPQTLAKAQEDYFFAISEAASEQVLAEYKAQNDDKDKVLAKRGMNVLTAEERAFYNDVTKSAGFKDGTILPDTIVERVFEDLQKERPLLKIISLTSWGAKTKVIFSRPKGKALWGSLHGDIKGQLDTEFYTLEFGNLKLTAFFVVSNDMLDLGPEWIDRYVRLCLGEAIADALEESIIKGDGDNQPIGLLKDLYNVSSGSKRADKDAKGQLTFKDGATIIKELGDLMAALTTYTKKKSNEDEGVKVTRTINGKVYLIVSPTTYYSIVTRATMQNANGAFVTNLPFITQEHIITSEHMPDDKLIAYVDGDYHAGVAGGEKVDKYKETLALQDATVYIAKLIANGQLVHNDASHVYTIKFPSK